MDSIFTAVLNSDKDEKTKQEFVARLIRLGTQPQAIDTVKGILRACIEFIVNGSTKMHVEWGQRVFIQWASHNNGIVEYFDLDVGHYLMQPNVWRHPANVPWLLQKSLKLLEDTKTSADMLINHATDVSERASRLCTVVSINATSFIKTHSSDVPSLVSFCRLLVAQPLCAPKSIKALSNFCLLVVNAITAAEWSVEVHAVIGPCLRSLWSRLDTVSIMDNLFTIFGLISRPDRDKIPLYCLGSVAQYFPSAAMEDAIRSTAANTTVSDADLVSAVCQMIDWLDCPWITNVDRWIGIFINGLASAHKYSVIIEITDLKIEQLFSCLGDVSKRSLVFPVFCHMLLSVQFSPSYFHKIVGSVPALLSRVKAEPADASQFLNSLSRLLHCLMALHSGFPDFYEPILDCIHDLVRPTAEEIRLILDSQKWKTGEKGKTGVQVAYGGRGVDGEYVKSSTGLTGLVNLRNTCYMNSVIQALYMADSWRNACMSSPISQSQPVLFRLQHLFALLTFSNRVAIAPDRFLAISRPSWFTEGAQQDCSEFLKHLLVTIHEQELACLRLSSSESAASLTSLSQSSVSLSTLDNNKDETITLPFNHTVSETLVKTERQPTVVEQHFGGCLVSTCRCLRCGNTSSKSELFTDLTLGFPTEDVCPATAKTSTAFIAGGGVTLGDGMTQGVADSNLQTSNESTAGVANTNGGVSKNDVVKESLVMGGGEIPGIEILKNFMKEQTSVQVRDPCPDVGDHVSLPTLLEHYLRVERLTGDNSYLCESCAMLVEGERSVKIVSTPVYLILTLLRFSFDAKRNARTKIMTEVHYPRIMQIPINRGCMDRVEKCASSSDCEGLLGGKTQTVVPYCLVAAIVHSGRSPESGHYYCYARHARPRADAQARMIGCESDLASDVFEDDWYLFNDTRVSQTSFDRFSNISSKFDTDTPYVLIYRRIAASDGASDLPGTTSYLSAADSRNIQLPTGIRQLVDDDNKRYLMEREQQERERSSKHHNDSTPRRPFYDDRNDPPGSCSGGGQGFNSGPPVVF